MLNKETQLTVGMHSRFWSSKFLRLTGDAMWTVKAPLRVGNGQTPVRLFIYLNNTELLRLRTCLLHSSAHCIQQCNGIPLQCLVWDASQGTFHLCCPLRSLNVHLPWKVGYLIACCLKSFVGLEKPLQDNFMQKEQHLSKNLYPTSAVHTILSSGWHCCSEANYFLHCLMEQSE